MRLAQGPSEDHAVNHGPFDQHLRADEIAAFVDRAVAGDRRAAIEAHLAACAECRAEAVEVSRIVRTTPHARPVPKRVWIPAVAAAALALFWMAPRAPRDLAAPEHREETVTVTLAPRPLAPVGSIDSAKVLMWSSVPSADGYRARLFDAEGTVLWEQETRDTSATLPASLSLRAGRSYYWRVEAHTGFDRSVASDLVEFVPHGGGPP
jgi:hypothetical protein